MSFPDDNPALDRAIELNKDRPISELPSFTDPNFSGGQGPSLVGAAIIGAATVSPKVRGYLWKTAKRGLFVMMIGAIPLAAAFVILGNVGAILGAIGMLIAAIGMLMTIYGTIFATVGKIGSTVYTAVRDDLDAEAEERGRRKR